MKHTVSYLTKHGFIYVLFENKEQAIAFINRKLALDKSITHINYRGLI